MAKVLASYVASWDPQKVVQEPKMSCSTKDALRLFLFNVCNGNKFDELVKKI